MGLMGQVSKETLKAGGKVHGIIPSAVSKSLSHRTLSASPALIS